jgi:hypothetical protein
MKLNDFYGKLMREAAGEPSGGTPAGDAPAAAPAAPAGPDLSFIPETFIKDGKPDLGAFSEHYKTLTAPKEVPDAYEFALPADLKFNDMPDFSFEVDAANPLYGELGGILKELGAPKDAAPKMVGLLAKYEASVAKAAQEAMKKEVESLGPKGQDRITEVARLLDTRLPKEQAEALRAVSSSALAVQALEKLLGAPAMNSPSPTPQEPAADPYASRYPKTSK